MKTKKRLYFFCLLAIISTIISVFLNRVKTDQASDVYFFQKSIKVNVLQLKNYVHQHIESFEKTGWKPSWNDILFNEKFHLHYYRNDSLALWSQNHMPVGRFIDIHFPCEGIVHLQNGWYYTHIFRKGNNLLCGSFLIKNDYPYINDDLRNDFASSFNLPNSHIISLERVKGCEIFDENHNFLFSLVPNSIHADSEFDAQFYILLYVAAFCFWIYFFYLFYQTIESHIRILFPPILVLFKVLMIHFSVVHFRVGEAALDPSIYGTNKWFPNFFEYLTNISIIVCIINILNKELIRLKFGKYHAIAVLLIVLPFWIFIRYMIQGLVENSSIPLSLSKLFSVNIYTILALLSIGSLLYAYYLLLRSVANKLFESNVRFYSLSAIVIGINSLLIFLLGYSFDLFQTIFILLFFHTLTAYQSYNQNKKLDFGLSVSTLLIAVIFISIMMRNYNIVREKTDRELYANQLATEQNIVTELEYGKLAEKVKTDPVLTRFATMGTNLSHSEFEEGLERRIFNGFWERYDMNFYLFNDSGKPVLGGEKSSEEDFTELNEITLDHSRTSDIDSNIYYITDNTEQYSYIIRQEIFTSDSIKFQLFITLRSKKIPEEIGFPRLLISSKADVLEPLEKYSIAKYHLGKLVVNYGAFTYPSNFGPIKTWKSNEPNFRDYGDYNHYVQRSSNGDIIVLSAKKAEFIDFISSFSYLYFFFGALLLPQFFHLYLGPLFKKNLSLSMKIQVIFIGLVFLSLFAFSWGSGVFVRDQYNDFSNNVISEKLNSIELDLKTKIGNANRLSIETHGNSLESSLERLAKIFKTDINVYDDKGFLVATSRSKLFNIGLISEQMNSKAVCAIRVNMKSRYIQDEHIGKLSYASAYLPYFNHRGSLIGFLNLQHFGQQKEFEDQIQQFLVSIINVFMLLLVTSIVAALFISNWLTAPLRILQENFAKLRFGKENVPIKYHKDDEIGALVNAYNLKLKELEFTAGQLAISERESAWRDMAKQVAHEIKNPLTPMKLSVQHMMRVFDPADPSSVEKLQKVTASIIEQIDALTLIANEFSNFAKMPLPQESTFDLIVLITNVIEVFREESGCVLEMTSSLSKAEITADKDQMIRVFNNLIKNAIQSIPSEKSGRIIVTLSETEEYWFIEIADNGVGIPDTERERIFVPYFTTKSTGTGIGLAMIKQIIENHHGSIYFSSEVNKGTTFSIELPKKF